MSNSPRERDLGFRQAKPAHPASAIEEEAIANNEVYSGISEVQHRHQGEVTGATIDKAMTGHNRPREFKS